MKRHKIKIGDCIYRVTNAPDAKTAKKVAKIVHDSKKAAKK